MNEISLEEFIRNLQTYELRRSSQVKEEIRKDKGLTLKAIESNDSDLDEEEMDMISRKHKKFFKRLEGSSRRGVPASQGAVIMISSLVASNVQNRITS